MQIQLLEKRGILKGSLNGRVLDLIRNMPGRAKWVDRELHFEPTAANIRHLKESFPEARWDDTTRRLHSVEELALLEADSAERKQPPESTMFAFKTTPREHQRAAFEWARRREWFAYFMEMGTGKTKPTIDVAADWWSSGIIDTLLLVAPNGVHRQFLEEQVEEHMPEFVNYVGHVYQSGKPVPAHIYKRNGALRILCINVEALSHQSGVKAASTFVQSGNTFMVVDEATRIKNPSAGRSKAAYTLGKMSRRRAILSGAPITRSAEDIFGQFKFLSEDALGFSSFYTFRARYCDVMPAYAGAPRGVVKVIGYKNMEELTKKIEAHSFRKTKAECLDLPPKVYLERHVAMTAEQRELYEEMRDEFTASFDGVTVDSTTAVARLLRLQQILCGHLPNEAGPGSYVKVPTNRLQAVLDWLDECGDKVVLWARFKADIDQLCQLLKKHDQTFVRYDGSVDQRSRSMARDNWLYGPVRVMVANPAAAATGQNWQIASDVGYYSNSFDAEHRWQSEDRTHRDGMTGVCTYTDFLCPGSIERRIVRSLRDKKSVATGLLDDPAGWLAAFNG